MKKLLSVVLLVQLSSAAWARGKQPPVQATQPSFTEQANSFNYRILEDDRGGFYAIWTHLRANNTFDLLAQHIGPDGKNLWADEGIRVEQNLLQSDAWDAASDGKTGFLLTWVENSRARGERFAIDGGKLWPERSGVSISTATAVNPVVMPDADGGGFFVWSERRYVDRWVLMSQHLNSKGFAVWPVEGARVSLRPSNQSRPKVIYDGASGVIVAWKDFLENASQLQIQRLDYQGTRLWGEQGELVVAPAGDSRDAPLVAPLGDGRAAIAWVAQSSNASRLFLQSVDPKGKFYWGPEGIALSYGAWDEWNPRLMGDGLGTLWVGWEDYRDHAHWQAFLAMIDRDAHSVWPNGEQALSPISADQGNLAFVEDGNKGVFAIWVDNRVGKTSIYAQEIDHAGTALFRENGKAQAKGLVNPRSLQIINLAPGIAAIGYVDVPRKGVWTLYWKFLIRGPVQASQASPAPVIDDKVNPPAGQEQVP